MGFSSCTQYARSNLLPILVIVAGFSASLLIVFAPATFLVANLIPDDAFYYFQIAQNIVHGVGPTVDGVNFTNGYHPLWLLILLPIFKFFSSGVVGDVTPVHAVLVVSALLNAGLGLVLLRIVSRYTQSAWIASLALAWWFFNPFNFYEMMSGLETPLSLFLISLFVLSAIRVSENDSRERLAATGVVGGLMILARLDNVFFFIMFLAYLWYRGGFRESLPKIILVGGIASLFVLPWFIWNWVTFGMLLTSSSIATTLVNHQLIIQDHGPALFQTLKAAVYETDYTLRDIAVRMGAPSVVFTFFGMALGWLTFGPKKYRIWARPVPVEFFIFGGFILNFIANASIRWAARTWYFIPLNLFLAMGLAWLLNELRGHVPIRKWVIACVLLLTLGLFYVGWSKHLRNVLVHQRDSVAAAEWINTNLPKDAVVGTFNSGVETYFSERRIVNLDGLVNNKALQALRARDLMAYVKNERIEYLIDWEVYFAYRFKSFWGVPDVFKDLTLVQTLGESELRVYKVK